MLEVLLNSIDTWYFTTKAGRAEQTSGSGLGLTSASNRPYKEWPQHEQLVSVYGIVEPFLDLPQFQS